MSFTVKVYYCDGDSEHMYDTDSELPYEWKSRDGARNALKCIKEHHQFITELEVFYKNYRDTCMKYKDAYSWYSDQFPEQQINVLLDDGSTKNFNCFWRGWPCRLIKAEVIEIAEKVDNPDVFEV